MRDLRSTLVSALVLALALAGLGAPSAAQTREVEGKQFVRERGRWHQVDPSGERFAVEDRVITIKLRGGVEAAAAVGLHAELRGEVIRRARTGFVDVRIPAGADVLDLVERYAASPLVELAEANTIGAYHFLPDDPSYGSQWHLPKIEAPMAWDTTPGDPAVIVAVLDSGSDVEHVDFGTGADAYQNVWLNPGEDAWTVPGNPATGNGIDDDSNGFVDDWKGWDFSNGNNDPRGPFFHGTAVAGVIGAKTDNGIGIAGVAGGRGAPGASVMTLGVGDAAPNASILDDAILYAAANGARIIQLSLTVGQSAAIDAALETVYDTDGLLVVCSSGNGGGASVSYPSSSPHVMSVGSTGPTDLKSSFSQFGTGLEIAAPGESIFMLDLNDQYGSSSGTSFASPIVSGIAALVLSAHPVLDNVALRQILRDTAEKVGGYDYDWNGAMPGHSQELGYGRVNAREALASLDLFADGFESGDTASWSVP